MVEIGPLLDQSSVPSPDGWNQDDETQQQQMLPSSTTTSSTTETATTLLMGTIVQRRCLGKSLAFATILVVKEPENIAASSIDDTTQRIAVAFRISSFPTTSATTTPFPTKPSQLPFGAQVEFHVIPATRPQGPSWEVVAWQILVDPRHEARVVAQVGDQGGVSCSKYLQARGQAYLTHNSHSYGGEMRVQKTRVGSSNEISVSESQQVDNTTRSSKNTVTTTNATTDNNGGHGDAHAKSMRARVFSAWLFQHVLRGDGTDVVLDVAGGKGHVSLELALQHQVPCTVMDPLMRHRQPKWYKRLQKAGAPVPQFVARPFGMDDTSRQWVLGGGMAREETSDGDGTTTNATKDASSSSSTSTTPFTCLVGLHPDECTQDILQMALQCNLSVAIVPCCVFPSLFPLRTLQSTGQVVQTYDDFLTFLLQQDERLQLATLPFQGKNQVIYYRADPKHDSIVDSHANTVENQGAG